MRPYIELIRPSVAFLSVLGVICGAILNNIYNPYLILFACVPAFLITGAGNVINDIYDVDIDKINKSHRPLPSGRISVRSAYFYYIFLVFLGNLLAIFVNYFYFLIAITSTVVSFVYAARLKKTPLIGNLCVAYLSSVTLLAGGLIHSKHLSEAVLIVFFTAFFGSVSREIIKDVEDIVADKKKGAVTLPVLFGRRFSYLISAVFAFSAFFIYSLLAFRSMVFLLIFLLGGMLTIFSFLKTPEIAQRYLKGVMFLVIIGTVTGVILYGS